MPFDVSRAQFQEEYEDIHGDILIIKTNSFYRSTNSFVSESIVVVLPAELSFNVSAGCQGLACFDDLQVGDFVEVDVAWSIEVFLCDQDTL